MTKWLEKVKLGDVFHDEDKTFEERRDEIVRRIQTTTWYVGSHHDDGELAMLVDELAETGGGDEFDEVWDYIYDIADADRVWIDTFK